MSKIPEQIEAELDSIKLIVKEIVSLIQKKGLNKHELNSAAFMLQNFYNGNENIIKQLFKIFNVKSNSSADWHRDLLWKANTEKFLSKKLTQKLMEYLRFRHYAIHNYMFKLRLELFKPLLVEVESVFLDFEKEISKVFR